MMEFPNQSVPEPIANFFNSLTETFCLTLARDRYQVYRDFLAAERGYNSNKLAILDKGFKNSPYKNQVGDYPQRLIQQPHLPVAGAKSYPNIGELPDIDEEGLNFLHPDIKQACVCIGGSAGAPFQGLWLGRNALDKEQYWSTTKIIPILNLLCAIEANIEGCIVCDENNNYPLIGMMEDVVTYDENIATSNSLSAMFKCFQTYENLEKWSIGITGNRDLEFQGLYGEEPFIGNPEIKAGDRTVMSAASESKSPATQPGENVVTAYDLTRLISMVGWHHHLSDSARLPGLTWEKLQPFIGAMGKDIARYVDVAIAKLGIENSLSSPVILSKMGFGHSSSRRRTELAYTCFTQFNYPEKPLSVAITLRAAKALGDFDREAVEIDARMATEVTEILRRLISGEFC